jgi:hypothetical protein
MSTLQRIVRKTARIELNGREIALLESALFDSLVRLLTDSKEFDISDPDDDAYTMEARMESETIKGLQRKLQFATTMLETEEAQ